MKKSVLLKWIAAGCGVLAIIMFFLPFVGNEGGNINGWQAIFGAEEEAFDFSFMNLVTLILVVLGAACCAMGAKKSDDKILPLVGAGVLALAGIFFFCAVSFSQIDSTLFEGMGMTGAALDLYIDLLKETLDIGVGAIIAGIACLGGAACSVVSFVLKNKEN